MLASSLRPLGELPPIRGTCRQRARRHALDPQVSRGSSASLLRLLLLASSCGAESGQGGTEGSCGAGRVGRCGPAAASAPGAWRTHRGMAGTVVTSFFPAGTLLLLRSTIGQGQGVLRRGGIGRHGILAAVRR